MNVHDHFPQTTRYSPYNERRPSTRSYASRRRQLRIVTIAKWVIGLTASAWIIKKAWNYASQNTQRKVTELLVEAQKLLQIITPAYAALFVADDTRRVLK